MDAHLFRQFCQLLEPLLGGARIEKIQEFGPDHLGITFFGSGSKQGLYFRFGRKAPFCFTSRERISGLPKPSAQVMRMRRYFAGRRIAAVVAQIWSRRIWLMASQEDSARPVWLCLDLAKGPSLHFLNTDELPEPEEARWPAQTEIGDALLDWRDWPVLTPGLRDTLEKLDLPEQAALLADLQDGGGDLFIYSDPAGEIRKISAWPLIDHKNLTEEISEDGLAAFERAGRDLVLADIFENQARRLVAPVMRRKKQLLNILEKMDADAARLSRMAARDVDGRLLAANLWRLPDSAGAESITIDEKRIALDRRFTLRQNMERLFHEARRGKRGLNMLAQRRNAVEAELASLDGRLVLPEAESQKPEAKLKPALINAPAHCQGFLSSDGHILLRGKDAKGNQALRKAAQGHDIWVHVEQGAGAHVLIRAPYAGYDIPERTLIEAGTLAANKSWLAQASSGSVMYAEARHIKACRSGAPGKVTIDKIRETRVVPVDHALEEKLAGSKKLVD